MPKNELRSKSRMYGWGFHVKIDGRRAAEHPAPRPSVYSIIPEFLRLRLEGPVILRVVEVFGKLSRDGCQSKSSDKNCTRQLSN